MEPIFKPKGAARDSDLGIALTAATALLGATLAQDDAVVAVAGVIVAGVILGAAVIWRYKLRAEGLVADARTYQLENHDADFEVNLPEDLVEDSDGETIGEFQDLIGADTSALLELDEVGEE